MTDLCSLSISQLSQGLAKKEFSCLELTEALFERIESLQGLNCFIDTWHEYATQNAKSSDARRAEGKPLSHFDGIPLAIKDNIATSYGRTTCGSRILENYKSPYSATAVQKLVDTGAVVLGKTNMDEFGMGSSNENSYFGPARNPWDVSRVPGGTSGGSAAAVCAGLVPAALGSDTGGSIRQPAAFCGVTGFKPTYGRVSRFGLVAYASSLDQIGVIAKDAVGCASVYERMAGFDINDSTSIDRDDFPLENAMKEGVRGLRVGVPSEYFQSGLGEEISKAVRLAISHFESEGAEIVDIQLPHTEAALAAYYILAPAEASSNLARYDGLRFGHRAEAKDLEQLYCQTRSEGFGSEVKRRILIGTYVLSQGYYDAYYLKAQKARTLVKDDFRNAFDEKCDVILCPTAPSSAFKLGEKTSDPLTMYLSDIYTIPVSLAGLPSISIPCGFDSGDLPIGLQIIGKPWDEKMVFRFASAYQESTDWHKRRPGMGAV